MDATPPRRPLTRDRVLRAAIELADRGGIDAISMRKLGQHLGVEAMSLYKHVANKDDVLDGIADLVTSEVDVPSPDDDWRTALRRSAISTHEMLRRHPWAGGVIESRRRLGPARLRYVDAVIGVLARAGFSMPVIGRAFMAIDSHSYGFALQEQAWSFDPSDASATAADFAAGLPPGQYPHLTAMTDAVASSPDSMGLDFEFGLDLFLDGLERLRPAG